MRRLSKVPLVLATIASTAAALGAGGGPASAASAASAKTYPPPSIHLQCTSAANGGALHGSVCALPPGVTTAPNSYSATIAMGKAGSAGATVAFAVTAGSLPPGLTLPAQSSGAGAVITGNPTRAGTFDFTVKATDGGLTATLAYQITIAVQGLPDQLACTSATGSFLINGVCVLPDAIAGQSYQGALPTSHNAGGTVGASGALPPGLSLSATFGSSRATISGTPAQSDAGNSYSFIVQGTGDQGQPLYQAYQLTVDPSQPLAIVPPASGSALSAATVGIAYAQSFFQSGGDGPYTWTVAAGQLPPGLALQTLSDPRNADDELTGTPAQASTFTFTMRLSDYTGQQATEQFSLTVEPPLQISATPLPTGTVGVPHSHDLPAQGGAAPYSWTVVDSINELPPGLTLGSTAPDFNNVLTGTPTEAGTFSFPMQVQDSQDNTVTGTVTITVKQ